MPSSSLFFWHARLILTNFLPASPYSAPSDIYRPVFLRINSVNSTESSVMRPQSTHIRYVASAFITLSLGISFLMNCSAYCLLSHRYLHNSSSQCCPLVNAATAAVIAKALGSATSSVFNAHHTLWRRLRFGTMTAAVCKPAILKHFVGAIHVILISAHSSETDANGTYSFCGCVISQ